MVSTRPTLCLVLLVQSFSSTVQVEYLEGKKSTEEDDLRICPEANQLFDEELNICLMIEDSDYDYETASALCTFKGSGLLNIDDERFWTLYLDRIDELFERYKFDLNVLYWIGLERHYSTWTYQLDKSSFDKSYYDLGGYNDYGYKERGYYATDDDGIIGYDCMSYDVDWVVMRPMNCSEKMRPICVLKNADRCKDPDACEQICQSGYRFQLCSCETGFMLKNVTHCKDIDECVCGNGECQQLCINTVGNRLCQCHSGYAMDESGKCVDIDECYWNFGGCNNYCLNTDGGFHCKCYSGWVYALNASCVFMSALSTSDDTDTLSSSHTSEQLKVVMQFLAWSVIGVSLMFIVLMSLYGIHVALTSKYEGERISRMHRRSKRKSNY